MLHFKVLVPVFCLVVFSSCLVYATSEDITTRVNVYSPRNVYVAWAVPEGRVGLPGTNWDTLYYLTVKDPSDGSILFSTSTLARTNVTGKDLTQVALLNVGVGAYNFYIKGHQSLTRKLSNVSLPSGLSPLNFTQPDNSPTFGTVRLLAGDINGATTSPAVMGDDVINAVDLGIMLSHLDQADPSTRDLRPNLNQDPVVNSVDMSLLLNNLDKEGDR